jgi:hypothetical protein
MLELQNWSLFSSHSFRLEEVKKVTSCNVNFVYNSLLPIIAKTEKRGSPL